jgi:hypothetical protein
MAARVFSAVVTISCVPAVIYLVVALFVSCGYLTMGALIIIVEGPSPPIAISVSSVVFG